MARYHTTAEGNIPFTAAEETERDAEEATWAAAADDRAAVDARDKRNDLLAATDFYALSDVVMTSEMTTYRSDLRAVPAQENFPTTINWPTAP